MNAYVVRTRDVRTVVEPIHDDGSGPSYDFLPIAPVVAGTRGRAKVLFLDEFSNRSRTGVESDDYLELRARLLAKNVDRAEGVCDDDDELWMLVP